ncbi:hypothetical protein FH972_025365 [Carpinus fangiana]|uniref:BHLH domain-containing protein n=1 Tax=Carpinus fangiana TaxID=176857 RepID=A0A5N6L175_9ROSI|nr:hypothetical protein FH972_025365 [Carpinus fangiana]
MALSTYSNMGALESLSSEMREAELLSYSNNFDLPLNTFLHPLYEEYPEDDTHHLLLPCLPSQYCDPLMISSLSEILTPQDLDPYSYPKRQKCHGNECFFDGFLPDFFSPMPQQTQMISSERSVSSQSIAARERRRKITEKTQELGRLIPGGNRMNTAEMLQAASKYVKFLQAQAGILQLMASFQEINGASPREEMQVILTSPSVQEKLYLEDKCLVPKELAKMLSKHCDIKSNPSISNDLNQLLRSEN